MKNRVALPAERSPTSVTTASLRLFFALWPDDRARRALARLSAEVAHHAQGRSPFGDGLHVTLAFLGSVPAERLDHVLQAGLRAARSVAPFVLELERVGGNAYGIAWLTPGRASAPLATLHGALAGELEAAGFPREKRMFRPHVTLARDCVRSAHRGLIAPIEWKAERLALVASTLAPGGSRYRDVADWPFAPVARQ